MPPDFYAQPILDLSRALIGCELLVDGVGGMIVEVEAYEASDPASHSFAGPTARNRAMFGPCGRAYVYRSYGMHWCLNVVGGRAPGAAVLLRAIEPRYGLDVMAPRRRTDDPHKLCAGPGRLCEALGVTRAHDALPFDAPLFALLPKAEEPPIVVGPRIGISKAADRPWRFGLAGSRFLSRPFPR
ncbi:DNA-3-methyladenine glycosylase [uncultured Sphingomonas sp.]|uniref:DNA-3-methyladenine glycosylase n=1 Tax=uncultured Sphingomonas sp. TaxID=158754 RepID=UPI0035CA831B